MTRFWSYLKIATRALAGHKFRSTLTVLSITLGAFELSFAMSFRGFTRVDGSAQVTSLQSRRDRWTRTGTRTGTQCPTRSIPS